MGADLYIECTEAEKYDKPLREEWDVAIANRDALIELYGGDKVRDTWKFKDPAVQEAQDRVEELANKMWDENPFYFRDSYNASNCLWPIEISYWHHVSEMLDEIALKEAKVRGYKDAEELYENDEEYRNILTPEYCLKLVEMIQEAEIEHGDPTDEYLAENCHVDDENSPEVWRKYYVEKRTRLKEFLWRGAESGGVRCSI